MSVHYSPDDKETESVGRWKIYTWHPSPSWSEGKNRSPTITLPLHEGWFISLYHYPRTNLRLSLYNEARTYLRPLYNKTNSCRLSMLRAVTVEFNVSLVSNCPGHLTSSGRDTSSDTGHPLQPITRRSQRRYRQRPYTQDIHDDTSFVILLMLKLLEALLMLLLWQTLQSSLPETSSGPMWQGGGRYDWRNAVIQVHKEKSKSYNWKILKVMSHGSAHLHGAKTWAKSRERHPDKWSSLVIYSSLVLLLP